MSATPQQGAFDFGDADPEPSPEPTPARAHSAQRPSPPPDSLVVRVRPDEPAIDREFDYLVPARFVPEIRVGTMVRIPLHGRRVGGWVTELDVEPPSGVTLASITKVTGWGPPPEVFDLAGWAAWRWAGRRATILRTASPPGAVRAVPDRRARVAGPARGATDPEFAAVIDEALSLPVATVRLPPAMSALPILRVACERGPILVAAPTLPMVRAHARDLRRAGVPVAMLPDDWAMARSGWSSVLGSRAAAWAPIAAPGAIVVLDEHDEALAQEQAPTWHARDVLVERARRLGIPCVLVSPIPSLEAMACGPVLTLPRSTERAGWPTVTVIDRRGDAPGSGLFSERIVDVLRSDARVVCILNRKGRARLLACGSCGAIGSCERCASAVVQSDAGVLVCPRCAAERPVICTECGATSMRTIRAGVSRVREELEALVREPVADISADGGTRDAHTRVVVGTEAALHVLARDAVDVVVFLDLDQELHAPQYRAAEQAMALLVRAARLVGGRDTGRLVLQTRRPDHEVVRAIVAADPTIVSAAEATRRELLGFPPVRAMALVSGASAPVWIEALGSRPDVEVLGPDDGRWILRAGSHPVLCDAIASVPRPPGRLRIDVDPLRV